MAVTGPVAILAGAGTGKTTTITHRIAHQVSSGAFDASQILAVTFTTKAAGELQQRLAALGVRGIEARTFHAAALSQLSRSWPRYMDADLPKVLDHKAGVISSLANALPRPQRFVPRRELAAEIEWAKNRMIPPGRYLGELGEHQPPITPELMLRIYEGYERRKASMRALDFEDILAFAIRLYDEHPDAAEELRSRFCAFTVDEFQDVNPLQAALLDRWLGERDDLCVVGDDYQTIYTFTGATPAYLLVITERFPHATVVRLEENYRSTPEILGAANRLAERMGGFAKTLRATRAPGPEPVSHALTSERSEVDAVVAAVRRLHAEESVPLEEIAILYRINARSELFEEAFAAARIPYQVRDGAFLRRPGPRAALARLRRMAGAGTVEAVDEVTSALGYDPEASSDSDEEITRQSDLARLRSLAAEFDGAHPGGDPVAFIAELERRFSTEHEGRGVNLLTYHRAKGLEFDAVFLPRLVDGELPYRSGRVRADPAEERRLLYVGITRARRFLFVTWSTDGRTKRSPFLDELGLSTKEARVLQQVGTHATVISRGGGRLMDRLKEWRRKRAKADGVPAYVVFQDRTLVEIAQQMPSDWADLAAISGVGPAKLDRYGDEVLQIVDAARPRS
jgi:DNA helicase-2/ATP-dependent DNA helicase PcrA